MKEVKSKKQKVKSEFKSFSCLTSHPLFYSPFSKKAFTLAEVLITLGIVAIVASITIPSLIQKKAEAETVAKLQKVYSTLTNAFDRAIQENGTPDLWGGETDDGGSSKVYLDTLATYLKIQNNCGNSPNCFPTTGYKTLDGGSDLPSQYINSSSYSHIQLNDGASLALIINVDIAYRKSTDIYAFILADVNGFNGPNKMGVDTFSFIMHQNKIVPAGSQQGGYYSFPTNCDKNSGTSEKNGQACTAWVIYNNNMDYRYCTGLSWNGKTKCQ